MYDAVVNIQKRTRTSVHWPSSLGAVAAATASRITRIAVHYEQQRALKRAARSNRNGQRRSFHYTNRPFLSFLFLLLLAIRRTTADVSAPELRVDAHLIDLGSAASRRMQMPLVSPVAYSSSSSFNYQPTLDSQECGSAALRPFASSSEIKTTWPVH